jgi:hypothetical protein
MMQSLTEPFTEEDASENFARVVTNSDNFKFESNDIGRMRGDMHTLITRLSTIYLSSKTVKTGEQTK